MIPFVVKEYLDKYAQSSWKIEVSEFKNISAAIVIPAIGEYENIRKLLLSLAQNDSEYFSSTLIIFVINNSETSLDEVKQDNEKSIELIRSIIKNNLSHEDELASQILSANLNIALVDASSSGYELPEKDSGVGLARKIGMDIALTTFDFNSEGKKILICLDADCIVEKNYLTEIIKTFQSKDISAAVVNYSHNLNGFDENKEAIICYEIFLRYYELGLKFANSPFAFQTIGSAMVCDYESYIKVEGMNKRKAAEDFYFLEKLAKSFSIKKINSTTVYPSSRRSWRVPFGTGQRVNRFLSKKQNEYLLYDPKSFKIMKEWLIIFNSELLLNINSFLQRAKEIDAGLYKFLIKNDFEKDWQRILNNSKTTDQINRQRLNWFDGFKTLKLIHYLRDTDYPLINMFDAIDKLLELMSAALPSSIMEFYTKRQKQLVPSIEIQMEYLTLLKNNL